MQGPTRRQVCVGTALAGISSALGACMPDGQTAGGLTPPPRAGTPLALADFRGRLGSMVTLDVNGSSRTLQLTAVRDHGPPVRRPQPHGECFTLLLEAQASVPAIATASYPANHPELGPFGLYLVSHLAPGMERPFYTATFSRL